MKNKIVLLAFLFASPAYAVDERYPVYAARPGLAGEAHVEGAPAPASLMALWPESFRMAQPGVALRIGAPQGGVRVKAAVEAVAVLVNAENPLTCIFLEDLYRLYTDENPKWKDGAPAMPLAREVQPGEGDFFAETVLRGAPFAPGVARVARYSALLDVVAAVPGAIGYAPAGYRGTGVKALQVSGGGDCVAPSAASAWRAEYPLARFVHLRGGDGEADKAFFGYVLSQAGQRDAVIAGFYPLPYVFAVEEREKLGLD